MIVDPHDRQLSLPSPSQVLLLAGVALCNDALLEHQAEGSGEIAAIGDPTEGALVIAAARFGHGPHLVHVCRRMDAVQPLSRDRLKPRLLTPLSEPCSCQSLRNPPDPLGVFREDVGLPTSNEQETMAHAARRRPPSPFSSPGSS